MAPKKKIEKKKRQLNKSNGVVGEISGFIFVCNGKTKENCYLNRVFGLSGSKMELVERIRPGTVLFLFDVELKILYGVYSATSNGARDLVPGAFGGAFPAQVRFKIDMDGFPLPESILKSAMKEIYISKSRFRLELNSQEVGQLLSLFRNVNLLQHPPPAMSLPHQQELPTTLPLRQPELPITLPLRQPELPTTLPLHQSELPITLPLRQPENQHRPPSFHLPPPEGPYGFGHMPHVSPTYVPSVAMPPWNGACYPAPPNNPYHQREITQSYYPVAPIPNECGSYMVAPQMVPRDSRPQAWSEWREGERVPWVGQGQPEGVHNPNHPLAMPGNGDPHRMYGDSAQREGERVPWVGQGQPEGVRNTNHPLAMPGNGDPHRMYGDSAQRQPSVKLAFNTCLPPGQSTCTWTASFD